MSHIKYELCDCAEIYFYNSKNKKKSQKNTQISLIPRNVF